MNEPVDRTLDHTFAAWVRRRSGSDTLGRAAFAVSRDEGQGHSCAALDGDIDHAALRAHAWVGDGAAFTPFVLSAHGDFYLWRNWQHETRLADALLRRARHEKLADNTDIDELFAGTDATDTRQQRAAVAAVRGARVFVLTGGPGTGKTSTVLRMLLMLLRDAKTTPTIALAAPTGKAAQRMAQSIATGKADLRRRLPATSKFRALLDGVPHAQAQTLHRLLDYRAHENTFARGADSPLAADIVVVDETSMVDLAMMRQLFDAVRDDATIILLGDPAQLYAVEAGSVLGDIVSAAHETSSPLAASVVTLRHVWRAERALNEHLERVRAGDVAWVDALDGAAVSAVRRFDSVDEKSLRARLDDWFATHIDEFRTLLSGDPDPADALARVRRFQILCALREGPFGAAGINTVLREIFEQRLGVDVAGEWHHGRPVIVTRNDYARDLFNGDIGIALRGPDGLRVWFETRDRDGQPTLRSLSTRTLPAHETAWAITIHRSQGSEYDDVAVVLPPQAEHRILSRELLYTAMSRAARHVELWTSAAALRAAVAQPVRRRGGLRARLA